MNKLLNFIATVAASTLLVVSCITSTRTHEPLTGAYSPYTRLTAEDAALFNAVMASHQEMKLTPKKVSRQVVAGMNYRFQCLDARGKKVEVVIYEPLPAAGKAHIISINGKAVE